MAFELFLPSFLVDDSDIIALMSLQNIDAGHLANLLPVVEQDIKGIAIIDIFEGNNVLTELGSEVM